MGLRAQLPIRRRRGFLASHHFRFTLDQLETLKRSEFKEDNVTILCDGVWLRVYQEPEAERNWEPVKTKLEEIEATARAIDFPLLEAAALRTRIMVVAEWEKDLNAAIALTESSLERLLLPTAAFSLWR